MLGQFGCGKNVGLREFGMAIKEEDRTIATRGGCGRSVWNLRVCLGNGEQSEEENFLLDRFWECDDDCWRDATDQGRAMHRPFGTCCARRSDCGGSTRWGRVRAQSQTPSRPLRTRFCVGDE